jgi:glycosyltransferase involved in cell wall biosynthesis
VTPGARRIRIAYCIDSFSVGGTEMNAVRTAEALDHDAFELCIVHLQADGPLRNRYEALPVTLRHVPIPNLYSPTTAAQGVRFASTLRAWGAAVVHTHDLYTNIFAAPWARMLSPARVLASRRWLYEAPRPGLVSINRISYRFAHKVLANSPSVARLLSRDERVPADKIVEIPNFVSEAAFAPTGGDDRASARLAWGVPADAFVVGTVARLSPVKNHALLLRAAALVDPSVHVLLIGDGPARAELVGLAESLGIASRVHFAGTVLSPSNLHRVLDVSVLCSLSEGFPNTLVEAMAAERPLIATPVGGVNDLVEHDRTGLFVPVDDPDALARAIELLRRDPALRSRLGREGHDVARARFHQTTVIASLARTYQSLAAHRA